MFVEPQLEVHAQDGKVVAAGRQRQIERAGSFCGWRLEEAEDRLGIAKDIGRADKSAQRPMDAGDGHFGAQRGRGALGIGQLFAGPNRPKGNVMGHDQSDGRLDLLGRGRERAP